MNYIFPLLVLAISRLVLRRISLVVRRQRTYWAARPVLVGDKTSDRGRTISALATVCLRDDICVPIL
ncbi:hypothetical protein [Bradyrhizobium sp. McL0616]|uniref:hypothetical protein n=1 Tax=Bradyrhizobium sp. McL0616 TaxID=3415674 RepID=UPI003CF2935D